MTIDIPRVIITPKGESRRTFEMFNLECEGLRKFQRVSRDITVRQLQTNIGFVISAEEMDGEDIARTDNRKCVDGFKRHTIRR